MTTTGKLLQFNRNQPQAPPPACSFTDEELEQICWVSLDEGILDPNDTVRFLAKEALELRWRQGGTL